VKTIGYLGLALIVAAIVRGGIDLFGNRIPTVISVRRQGLLAILGVVLCVLGFVRHEVEECSELRQTIYSQPPPTLILNVPDPETDRITDVFIDRVLDRKGGGQINPHIEKSDATGAVAICAAQEDTTSNGRCRLRAKVNTTLLHWGNCPKLPEPQ
jgi:hypothetical protein